MRSHELTGWVSPSATVAIADRASEWMDCSGHATLSAERRHCSSARLACRRRAATWAWADAADAMRKRARRLALTIHRHAIHAVLAVRWFICERECSRSRSGECEQGQQQQQSGGGGSAHGVCVCVCDVAVSGSLSFTVTVRQAEGRGGE